MRLRKINREEAERDESHDPLGIDTSYLIHYGYTFVHIVAPSRASHFGCPSRRFSVRPHSYDFEAAPPIVMTMRRLP